ncbi:MAG: hypothetical protein Q7J80_02605 [Anaerolineales bacterium]|nr:hypothetical protein [Anaerolineales bacterium]
MAKVWELLDQAHYYIGKSYYADAQNILDQILNADPQNVEAWDAYIRICTTQNDLEDLRNHIDNVWQTRVRDQDFLHAKQRFVLQRLNEKINTL